MLIVGLDDLKGLFHEMNFPWEILFIAWIKEAQGGFYCSIQIKGGCSKVGVNVFSQASSDKIRGNDQKLCQEKFSLDIRNTFFTERVVKYWNRLPRGVVELPFLKMFKK